MRGGLRTGPGKSTEKEGESDEKAKERKERGVCSKTEPAAQKGGVAAWPQQPASGCTG